MIEFPGELVFAIPRSEVEGAGPLVVRATAFRNAGAVTGIPDPAFSVLDVTGENPLDPLVEIDLAEVAEAKNLGALPPDAEGQGPQRTDRGGEDLLLATITEITDGYIGRLDAALAAGSDGATLEAYLSALTTDAYPAGACAAVLDASLAQAVGLEAVAAPVEFVLEPTLGVVAHDVATKLTYPTGVVDFTLRLVRTSPGDVGALISCS